MYVKVVSSGGDIQYWQLRKKLHRAPVITITGSVDQADHQVNL